MIVVEFSLSQKVFHKISIEEMLVKNISSSLQKIKTDFIPVAVFQSDENEEEHSKADNFIKAMSILKED